MKRNAVFLLGVVAVAALLVGCHDSGRQPASADLSAEAQRFTHEALVLDMHIDLPYRLKEQPADVTTRTPDGHFDAVRARQGGLDAAFVAIYVPASLQGTGTEKQLADELIDMMEEIADQSPETFRIVRSPDELRAAHAESVIAWPVGIENGAAIEDDLANLEHFFARGVRYVTLTHSRANQICDSSYDENRPWQGLSPFGEQVVAEMNRLGMMIDVSHVSDQAFERVLELSSAPVVATHSCCRAFTPGFERNLTDEMITKLAEKGGVVNIAFGSGFLNDTARRESEEAWAAVGRYLEEHGLGWDSDEVGKQLEAYEREHPPTPTTVSDVADHIEHVIQLVGIEHVGLGSDFDGISQAPTGLEDVSGYPNLVAELMRRGHSEEEIRKICGENMLRVWSAIELASREQGLDS